MPLVDLLAKRWRRWRDYVAKSEEDRQNVFKQLNAEERKKDCQEVAIILWEADGKPENSDNRYYVKAQKRLAGFRWQLYKLNKPFIWLEKKIIEPLDRWSSRANIFKLFSKLSPIIQAIGVVAIPIMIFYFENQREERQLRFEKNLISVQAEVRHQQAVRDFLSQVTTIHLESEQGKKLREDVELRTLLEATTRALFEELSVSVDSRSDLPDSSEFDRKAIKGDRKRQVVKFLSDLGWINGSKEKKPLLLLQKSNLSNANLMSTNLEGVNLEKSNLFNGNLGEANLKEANLKGANLVFANLVFANLEGANLMLANLEGANLMLANLRGANLMLANLRGANLQSASLRGANLKKANLVNISVLPPSKIRSACSWQSAVYKEDKNENQKYLEKLKEETLLDSKEPSDCSKWR